MRLVLSALLLPAFMWAAPITYTAEFSFPAAGDQFVSFDPWGFQVNMGGILADTLVNLNDAPSFSLSGMPYSDAVWDHGYVNDSTIMNEMYAFLRFNSPSIGRFQLYAKTNAVLDNGTYGLWGKVYGVPFEFISPGTLIVHTPEPGTWATIITGLIAFGCIKRSILS